MENASFVWRTYDKTEELKMKTQNIKEKVDENYIEKAYITENGKNEVFNFVDLVV